MKYKLSITLFVFLLFLTSNSNYVNAQPLSSNKPPVIGIFGDIHGNQDVMEKVLIQMKERGVTHIIGTGDFISNKRGVTHGNTGNLIIVEGAEMLEEMISQITPITGVPKDKIFLCPGNWEHETVDFPEQMNEKLKKYGNLIFEKHDGYGFVEIENEKIMVSHFPQHPIPEEFLPPPRFRQKISSRVTSVMETVEKGIYPPMDVSFEIFAHNHIAGSFVDKKTGKLVVNAGVLDNVAKSPTEPRGYAIYEAQKGEIHFIDFEKRKTITSVNVIGKKKPNATRDCLRFLLMSTLAH